MMCMREHIYRLNGNHFIFSIQQRQVACLRCRITTDINNTFGFGKQNRIYYIIVHTCTRRIGNDNIRTTVFINKLLSKNIFHISRIEQCIGNMVYLRIYFSIFNRFRHILYANHFLCLTRHEICNCSGSGIKVIDKLISGQTCKIACYLI